MIAGASLLQGAAQAATAAFVLTGGGSILRHRHPPGLYGVGGGLVVPAEVGLVPQTVSPGRLQQANALQGLSRNLTGILGPAIGGALVVAGSPGSALGIDALSFVVCAAILYRIRIAPRASTDEREGFVHELRAGWKEFTSRTWLWASVILFGIGEPRLLRVDHPRAGDREGGSRRRRSVGDDRRGQRRRRRSRQPDRAARAPEAAARRVHALGDTAARARCSSSCWRRPCGCSRSLRSAPAPGIAVHLTLWFTLFQREIPEQMQSRVSSYDVLGSFVLMPIGFAIVGPLSDAIGVTETLWLSFGVMLTTWALILSLPSVWALKAPAADQPTDPTLTLMTVRVRMAPSPTGFLHIGGVRTFLFNWLFARGQGGECLLRIENTDTSREVAEAVGQIEESLRWLGIEWDGETRFQLDGAERCRTEAARLVAEDKAYEDDGAIRIRMPKEGVIGWDDAIKGRIEFPAAELEDMVILRSDGRPVYNYASPVDDWIDGITHVIRGDDHVSNTPKQIVVLEALGAELPIYAHAPNIFGDDGKKLSKRHGAHVDREFRDAGYIAPALMNFLALLGWAPDGETTIMSRDELVERFTLERVGASPATFDYAKLDWMNGQYLRALDVDAYADALVTYLREQGIDWDEARIRAAAPIVQEKMGRLGEFPDFARFLFEDVEPDPALLDAAILSRAADELEPLEPWDAPSLEAALKLLCEHLDAKPKTVYLPIRVAVTGSRISPGLYESLELLGRDVSLARLRRGAALAG